MIIIENPFKEGDEVWGIHYSYAAKNWQTVSIHWSDKLSYIPNVMWKSKQEAIDGMISRLKELENDNQ
jgi:hypothetical protein